MEAKKGSLRSLSIAPMPSPPTRSSLSSCSATRTRIAPWTVSTSPCSTPQITAFWRRDPIRVVEDLAVPGLTPYEMRAHFSNTTQVNAGNVDLDAIAVNYLQANESYVTFVDWRPYAIENGEPIEVKLHRFGNLSSSAS